MMNNFAFFILTHGRPDKQITYKSLRKTGYTGKVYFILDDEDKTRHQYEEKYGKENIIVFSKSEISKKFDEAIISKDRRSIVYARNACFEIAKNLGLTHFMQLDDDYTQFSWRFYLNKNNEFVYKYIYNLQKIEKVIESLILFLDSTPTKSIAFAQGGDFIGGGEGGFGQKIFLSRKCMNTFLCSTNKPFTFEGKINEDVNTYTHKASTGDLFFTTNIAFISQMMTQSNSGGMTDIYLESGTYVKSFFSVLFHPSAVKIKAMGDKNKRIHHSVEWNATTPKILREELKKR